MASPDLDNIIYDLVDEDGPVWFRLQKAFPLLLVVFLLGAWSMVATIRVGERLDAENAAGSPVSVGFDASSSAIRVCEGGAQMLPDFSIVVAGDDPSLPHLRQFAIVLVATDPRYGRAVPTEVMCALPE